MRTRLCICIRSVSHFLRMAQTRKNKSSQVNKMTNHRCMTSISSPQYIKYTLKCLLLSPSTTGVSVGPPPVGGCFDDFEMKSWKTLNLSIAYFIFFFFLKSLFFALVRVRVRVGRVKSELWARNLIRPRC